MKSALQHQAWREYNAAVRHGILVPQPCERCGSSARVHGHHEDYSQPLAVNWLCYLCHARRHAELRKLRGEKIVRSGWRPRFESARITEDMALRGWNRSDLARAAGVSDMTVTRFFRGDAQTAKSAAKFAQALGYTVRRYFSHVEAVA
jgi:hypothetical protein